MGESACRVLVGMKILQIRKKGRSDKGQKRCSNTWGWKTWEKKTIRGRPVWFFFFLGVGPKSTSSISKTCRSKHRHKKVSEMEV